MKREITLIIFFNFLFINSLYAYNNENKCEDYLSKDKPAEAIIAAKSLTSKYDSNFCEAKAKYYGFASYIKFFGNAECMPLASRFNLLPKNLRHLFYRYISVIFFIVIFFIVIFFIVLRTNFTFSSLSSLSSSSLSSSSLS